MGIHLKCSASSVPGRCMLEGPMHIEHSMYTMGHCFTNGTCRHLPAGQDHLHRAMNVADALLLCWTAPGQRRLRVARHPEASWPLTAAVSAGVASFFVLYFGILLLFFMVRFGPTAFVSSMEYPTCYCLCF